MFAECCVDGFALDGLFSPFQESKHVKIELYDVEGKSSILWMYDKARFRRQTIHEPRT